MPAPSAGNLGTGPSNARSELCPVITSLHWEAIELELIAAGCVDEFQDVVTGLREGVRIGVSGPVPVTFAPPNHSSAEDHADVLLPNIHAEISARRYSGPFSQDRLEALIGPFRSSPLGAVPKSTPGKWRTIQDFSFPRHDDSVESVNAGINTDDYKCRWDSFMECALLVAECPEGTQVSINDVEGAYRNIPIHPDDQPWVVVRWGHFFYIDHCLAFGLCTAPFLWTRPADAIKRIFLNHLIDLILKWVDDYGMVRFPIGRSELGAFLYRVDESVIFEVAARIGLQWSMPKHLPFADALPFIGFWWDIPQRSVQIPQAKKEKYLLRLEP